MIWKQISIDEKPEPQRRRAWNTWWSVPQCSWGWSACTLSWKLPAVVFQGQPEKAASVRKWWNGKSFYDLNTNSCVVSIQLHRGLSGKQQFGIFVITVLSEWSYPFLWLYIKTKKGAFANKNSHFKDQFRFLNYQVSVPSNPLSIHSWPDEVLC